jgi:hypothetical protein
LLHHPHVHCVVPGGGLSPDDTRWIGCRQTFFLPIKVLSRVFRGKFLELLDAAAHGGALTFSGPTALSDLEAWKGFVRQMRGKEWVVYAKPPFGSPTRVLKYLARYTHRVAISNRRIVSITDDEVTFRYRDRTRENEIRTMKLRGVEFLRRFLLHVLPKGFVRIRHFGLLANRVRKTNLDRCRSLLGILTTTEPDPEAASANSDESSDLLCPTCHLGRLRWIAVLPPGAPHRPHPVLSHGSTPHERRFSVTACTNPDELRSFDAHLCPSPPQARSRPDPRPLLPSSSHPCMRPTASPFASSRYAGA